MEQKMVRFWKGYSAKSGQKTAEKKETAQQKHNKNTTNNGAIMPLHYLCFKRIYCGERLFLYSSFFVNSTYQNGKRRIYAAHNQRGKCRLRDLQCHKKQLKKKNSTTKSGAIMPLRYLCFGRIYCGKYKAALFKVLANVNVKSYFMPRKYQAYKTKSSRL